MQTERPDSRFMELTVDWLLGVLESWYNDQSISNGKTSKSWRKMVLGVVLPANMRLSEPTWKCWTWWHAVVCAGEAGGRIPSSRSSTTTY